jgi:hypothetical protein
VKALQQFAPIPDMPNRLTLDRWLDTYPQFREQFDTRTRLHEPEMMRVRWFARR